MKTLILLAGAAALASTGAALARPPHAGQGKGQGAAMGQRGLDIPRGAIGQRGFGSQYGYGLGGCPPGLQNKGCMPPGLARQQFQPGQRLPFGQQGLLGYNSLPYNLRTHYGPQLDPYSGYVYDSNYLYRVDPATMVVQQVLSALIRR